MATYTPNLNLKKPSTGEYYDMVADLNDSKDKIDKGFADNINVMPSSLRIAFSYSYENNPEKLKLLKSLGFNCIYTGKVINSFFWDIPRTKAFLDQMLDNGIYVILGIDENTMINSNFIDEQNYVSALNDHPAIIGYHSFDEPTANMIPIVTQQLFYDRIKQVTTKNIYVVDGNYDQEKHGHYYSDNVYDIYMYDIYLHQLTGEAVKVNDIPTIKAKIFTQLMIINNTFGYRAPSKFIPVLPFYAQQENPLGQLQPDELKAYLDVYSLFDNIEDYAVFAFDLSLYPPDGMYPYLLGNSLHLQKLCTNLHSGIHKNNQEIVTITPKNFEKHDAYISSSNMKYDGTTFDKISVIDQATSPVGVQEIVFKLKSSNKSQDLCVNTMATNSQDNNSRTITHEYSLDGVNFTDCGSAKSGADSFVLIGYTHKTTITTIPKNVNTVFIKVKMVSTTNIGTDNSNVGIRTISATII